MNLERVKQAVELKPLQVERKRSSHPLVVAALTATLALLTSGRVARAEYSVGPGYCELGWTFTAQVDDDAGKAKNWQEGCNINDTIEELEPSVEVALILSREDEIGGGVYTPYFFQLPCQDANRFSIKDVIKSTTDVRGFGSNGVSGGINPNYPQFVNFWVNTKFPNGTFAKNQLIECLRDNQVISSHLVRVSIDLSD